MTRGSPKSLFARFRVTSLATLLSRVLGMVRDISMAALLGLSSGPAMDAFVVAFRLPDLFRRLFAEGGLSASFLPVLTERLQTDRQAARQLVTSMLVAVSLVLLIVVLAGELICSGLLITTAKGASAPSSWRLAIELTAILLPYVLLICIASQLAAALNAMNHFAGPGLAPSVLNICWLAGVAAAPLFSDQQEQQVRILAVFILIAGVLQVGLQVAALWSLEFRPSWNWSATKPLMKRVSRSMLPALLGLSATQINTVADTVLAWSFSAGSLVSTTWLSSMATLEQGAASAVYYGERFYMFPLGLIGLATATAIFPSLSGKAARGDLHGLSRHLTGGLCLIGFLAIPASAGLILLAEPIVKALLQRGAFSGDDTLRTASMLRAYAVGVWAYCALPVMIRAFYANKDVLLPARVGVAAIVANLLLSVLLLRLLGEFGLALATSVVATVQMLVLIVAFSRRHVPVHGSLLWLSTSKTMLATGAMVIVGIGIAQVPEGTWTRHLSVELAGILLACTLVYLGCSRLLGAPEWKLLKNRGTDLPE